MYGNMVKLFAAPIFGNDIEAGEFNREIARKKIAGLQSRGCIVSVVKVNSDRYLVTYREKIRAEYTEYGPYDVRTAAKRRKLLRAKGFRVKAKVFNLGGRPQAALMVRHNEAPKHSGYPNWPQHKREASKASAHARHVDSMPKVSEYLV